MMQAAGWLEDPMKKRLAIRSRLTRKVTRSSADADNRIDAFSGQSRSTNMVPFHM